MFDFDPFNLFKRAFMTKEEKANEIVQNHALYAAGAGLIPVPFVDVAGVTAIQLKMIRDLCNVYNAEFNESLIKSIVASLVGTSLARVGASLLKAIPGVGSLIGGVSMSVMSGATTYAVGQVFYKELQTNGNLTNLNIDSARRIFEQEVEKGKEFVNRSQKNTNNPKSDTAKDEVVSKLERLKELRDSGILSEEEFQQKKAALLEKL